MKTLYLIGGTMGVGKTAVSQQLNKDLANSVFLDGDWCWYASPFQVTEETKAMVLDNICHLLNQFLHCSAYDNIIFCWVMHQQSIIDSILDKLDTKNCTVKCVSLIADEESLRERFTADARCGVRNIDDIDKSLARLPLYRSLKSIQIDTSNKSIQRVADEVRYCSP